MANQESHEYDIIFAGGGTAACIAAGRLAKADPNLSILVVEGGKNNHNDPTVVNPAMFLVHLAPDSQTALFYKANKEEALNGREAIVPMGGILGGGSSINFMMYTRAQGVDFDAWKMEGWDAKGVLPYAKKLETYHCDGPNTDRSVHGYDGPVHISHGTHLAKNAQDDFIEAASAVGYKEIPDLQDFKACNGFARWARYVSPDGKRQDTAHRYIHPLLEEKKAPKLHLQVESKVSRVLFEGTKAVGVEFVPSASFQPTIELSKPVPQIAKARKLVVVACGALGTPSVLERSGVGSAEVLKKLDIPVVSDLPGVGEEYQDHNLLLYPYRAQLKADETLDELLSGKRDFTQSIKDKYPLLGWNAIDTCSKIRPTEAEIDELGTDFRKLWDRDFANEPERPLMLMGVVSTFLGDHKILNEDTETFFTLGAYTAYPYSRGNIHITSTDPQTPASFNTGFLSHPADLKKQLWAYKKQREIARRSNAYIGEVALGHPTFPEGSKASLLKTAAQDGGFKTAEERKNLKPIEYDANDDAAIEDFIRSNLNTTWHSCGTCRMAPREEGGVVDKDLNVYGTQGLKIADLSIVRENVGANTNNTALIVGEKAADIIGKELGLTV